MPGPAVDPALVTAWELLLGAEVRGRPPGASVHRMKRLVETLRKMVLERRQPEASTVYCRAR